MSGGAYSSSSFGWQFRQGWRRLGEWVEYRVSRVEVDLPDWDWDWNWPDWDLPPIVGQVLYWGGCRGLVRFG